MKDCWLVVMCFFDEKEELQWNQVVQQECPRIVIQEDESFVSKNSTSSPSTTTTSIPSSSSTSSLSSSPSPPPRKVKSLNEIYGYSNFSLMSHIEE